MKFKKLAIVAAIFAATATGAMAEDSRTLTIHEVDALAHNAPALIATLGQPDEIIPTTVGGEVLATTWVYRDRALNGGIKTDVNMFFGQDGFAQAVFVNGKMIRVVITGNEKPEDFCNGKGVPTMARVLANS